jgi:hypothetical protein
MRYVLRMQKLGSDKIYKKSCVTNNISNLIGILGRNGWHVITYCEHSDSDLIIV